MGSTTLKLRLTAQAQVDLDDLWDYIAANASEAVATRLLDAIAAACVRLLRFPHSGPARPQLAENLRVTFAGTYAIYYTATATDLIMVRVVHAARDATTIAETGGCAL